jgi:DNA-binding transcriptional MocR family regulator
MSLLSHRVRNAVGERPLYLRLADVLVEIIGNSDGVLPSARELAVREGFNRATVNAAYRELARRGLLAIRRGRPRKGAPRPASVAPYTETEPPLGAIDLARYAPDRDLLPGGRVFRWLGLGEGEGESVAQYGSAAGYPPLRRWLAERLCSLDIAAHPERIVLTSGVQHALDLLLRAVAHPGDNVLVEDPTYPGLPPLLAVHGVRPIGLPVGARGIVVAELDEILRRAHPRLAIVTPTLHNPSGFVWDETTRCAVLERLTSTGCHIVEEFFDPALVVHGGVPSSLAARDPRVVAVGSFSKALFPGLRVGWLAGAREVVAAVTAVKRATDLSGSPFLEATAYHLCDRGILTQQLARLRQASEIRWNLVKGALSAAPRGVDWSVPRGGFSTLVRLPSGWSSQAIAAQAVRAGVWVVPGPVMSVSRRDDVMRVAFAAANGEQLVVGVRRLVDVLAPSPMAVPLA